MDNLHEELPFYIKAGLGVPFQSVLDANISSIRNLNGKWGLYVNHYGSWSKRKNYDGLKTPGSQTFNTVGVFGEHRFGRSVLEARSGSITTRSAAMDIALRG